MRVIQIVPVLAILTATVLVASLFAFSVVGSVEAKLPEKPLAAITLTVARVDIVHTEDAAIESEVITVLEPESPFLINLLDLQDGVLTGLAALGTLDLPAGLVTQIRIVVIDATITFNGDKTPLKIPAGVVRLNGVLELPGGDAAFDFDVEKSVKSNKRHDFILKPIIKFEST